MNTYAVELNPIFPDLFTVLIFGTIKTRKGCRKVVEAVLYREHFTEAAGKTCVDYRTTYVGLFGVIADDLKGRGLLAM